MTDSPLNALRDDLKRMSAYKVQDASGFIKLDAMENPFSLPKEISKKWIERLSLVEINRYPNPKADSLESKLRSKLGLSEKYGLLFGNGSDELIQILMLACAKPDAKVLSVEPSFVMYRLLAQFCGLEYIPIELAEDFSLDFENFKQEIITHQPELVFLAQPNNPTGNLFRHEQIEELINLSTGLFVLDEAYTDFTDYDGLSLTGSKDNLLILRTFSKTGLAGVRFGFLIGCKSIVDELDKLRLPYNVNVLTQSLVEVVLENFDLLEQQTKTLRKLREDLYKELSSLKELQVFPSEANFITIRLLSGDAKTVALKLKGQGVLVKVLHGSHELLKNCLRLTVGTKAQNEVLIQAIKASF